MTSSSRGGSRGDDRSQRFLIGCAAFIGLLVLLVVLVRLAGVLFGTILFVVVLAAIWTLVANRGVAGAQLIDDIMLSLPVWGRLHARFIRPSTYFSEDTRLVFQQAVHTVVADHISALLEAKGVRALAREALSPQTRPLL